MTTEYATTEYADYAEAARAVEAAAHAAAAAAKASGSRAALRSSEFLLREAVANHQRAANTAPSAEALEMHTTACRELLEVIAWHIRVVPSKK